MCLCYSLFAIEQTHIRLDRGNGTHRRHEYGDQAIKERDCVRVLTGCILTDACLEALSGGIFKPAASSSALTYAATHANPLSQLTNPRETTIDPLLCSLLNDYPTDVTGVDLDLHTRLISSIFSPLTLLTPIHLIGPSALPPHEEDPLLDSSCFSPSDWARIAEDIEHAYHSYDGFVVCMGTDTMAYTASALSFMLENLGKTVSV